MLCVIFVALHTRECLVIYIYGYSKSKYHISWFQDTPDLLTNFGKILGYVKWTHFFGASILVMIIR